ncbi:MAG: hypothetical protein QG577_1646 [Thermodesulfobacteriota bacterium]|nr:hypothetical protein [Thermodesulfobacteriota bacterium]
MSLINSVSGIRFWEPLAAYMSQETTALVFFLIWSTNVIMKIVHLITIPHMRTERSLAASNVLSSGFSFVLFPFTTLTEILIVRILEKAW